MESAPILINKKYLEDVFGREDLEEQLDTEFYEAGESIAMTHLLELAVDYKLHLAI